MLSVGYPSPAPKLRTVRLASVALNQINISWYYDGHTDPASLTFLIYLNDRLVQRVGGEVREATIFAPSEGLHDVEVIPWRSDLRYPHTIYGAATFRRLHMDFTPNPVPLSIKSYQVHKLNPLTSSPEVFDEKTAISAEVGWHRFHLSNVWAEVAGSFTDSSFNTNSTLTVKYVAATDQLEITSPSEPTPLLVFFRDREIVDMYRGLSIRVEGKALLQDGDAFTINLGILPYYDTPALDNGNHIFYITSVGKNGNAGPLSDPVNLQVYNPPDPPSGLSVTWSGSAWVLSGLSSSPTVRVYSNYCGTTGVILPYIYYDYRFKEAAVTDGEFSINLGALPGSGVVSLVCRSVDALGVESDTVDQLNVTIPYVPADLPDVMNLTGLHVGNGSVELKWFSASIPPFDEDRPLGYWHVDTNLTSLDSSFQAKATIENNFIEWTLVIDAPPLGSSSETFTVRSQDLDGTRFGNPASVFVEVDTSTPAKLTINKSQGF